MAIAKSLLCWIGGKARIVARILPWFPPHHCYVEPFGGGASVLLTKAPSKVEVYNDIDSGLTNLFSVLRDNGEDVFVRAGLTPHSRFEQRRTRKNLKNAACYFVAYRQSFGGKLSGYALSPSMTNIVPGYLKAVNNLSVMHRRLKNVIVHNEDALNIIRRYDAKDTLFYLDPPYVISSWGINHGVYSQLMTDEQHEDLLSLIKTVKGMVVLSGYANPIYDKLPWRKIEFDITCGIAARTKGRNLKGRGTVKENQSRTECLWVNKAVETRLNARHSKK